MPSQLVIILGVLLWLILALPVAYQYLLVLAAVRQQAAQPRPNPMTRFAIVLPAHDEETVIGRTVTTLRAMDYPATHFDVHVVADHCTDGTAAVAQAAGAIVHERTAGPRSGKGSALRWGFAEVLGSDSNQASTYDAVAVFDADSQVAPDFLRVMDARLTAGDRVIQGQHRIANPDDGWFPALTWAMFILTNRVQNQGRSNLGFSAGNMGDAICLTDEALRTTGWGEGLTEDYDLRLNLLLHGIRIVYEPAAIAYGEAPATWALARQQRARWLAGSYRSGRRHLRALARAALRRRDPALWDGLVQVILPSYSTLTVLVLAAIVLLTALAWLAGTALGTAWLAAWGVLLGALVLYPFLGLALAHAPRRAYLVILTGPVFILWRTALALVARSQREVTWVRTARRGAGRPSTNEDSE